jgi:hypothetical protein
MSDKLQNGDYPRYLYKYCSWKKKHHREILAEQVIYFASSRKFNDPFDCRVNLRYDRLSIDDIQNLRRRLLRAEYPHYSAIDIEILLRDCLSDNPFSDNSYSDRAFLQMEKYKEENAGMFCLTEDCLNLLMWSHYADSHCGFCIGFDVETMDDYFESLAQNKVLIEICPVEYHDKYPVINPIQLSDEEWVKKQLTIKSSQWAHEKEYRCILVGETNRPFNIPKEAFREVVLGCQMKDKERVEILETISKSNIDVKIFRTEKMKFKFGLELCRIN